MQIFLIPHTEDGSGILTIDDVRREVQAAAERATTLGHPMVRVLRDGWFTIP